MSDIEKVIAEVARIREHYFGEMTSYEGDALDAAIALLKARETTRFVKISPAGIYECEKCGQQVMTKDIEVYHYCHGCGRAVKWDD